MKEASEWENDREWLLSKHANASESIIDLFCERVSIMWADGKLSDDEARRLALKSLNLD